MRFIAYKKGRRGPAVTIKSRDEIRGQGQLTARACASGPEEVGQA